MFADNSVLMSVPQDPVLATENLRKDLEVVRNYFLSLNLLLNTKKTKIMNFSRFWHNMNRVNFPEIQVDGAVIEQVRSFKYLGVTIDLNLRFNIHKNNCIRNANGKLHMLGKIRDFIPTKTALMLYKTMILPR